MVMEYLDGCDLGAEIANSGPLPIADAVEYVLQACEAMIEAHEGGIIHRDLKPENLFLSRNGQARTVKILDFGISRVSHPGEMRVTQTQSSFGTPLYMSPEQVRSTKNVDQRTDIWSLGVIFYELVTGEPPFTGETPTAVAVSITVDKFTSLRKLRTDIPVALDLVIARALEKEPEKRFASMREFADALKPFRGTPSSATPFVGARQTSSTSRTLRVSNAEVAARTGSKRTTPAWIAYAVGGGVLAVLVIGSLAIRASWQTRSGAASPNAAATTASPTPGRTVPELATAVPDTPATADTGHTQAVVDVTPSSAPTKA